MKQGIILTVLTGLALLGYGCKTSVGHPLAEPIQYSDEIVLTNGVVRLGYSPAVGRIVAFGKVGGKDLLWRNCTTIIAAQRQNGKCWVNYGGDKIWPTVQDLWPRIYGSSEPFWPDPNIDGGKWRVIERGNNRLVVESSRSAYLGIKIRREIMLTSGKAEATIKNTLKQLARTPFPVCIWSVTQIKPPEYCLMEINASRPQAAAYVDFYDAKSPARAQVIWEDSVLKFACKAGERSKVGSFGRWITAVYQDCLFRQSSEYKLDACYPDNASVECFWSNRVIVRDLKSWSPNHTELELLGGAVHLQPGEQISNIVHWEITDRPLR